MEALAKSGLEVGYVVADPFVARTLSERTYLPVLLTRSMESYEDFILARNVRAVFYVNNSQANFTALRVTSPIHIHLNHGESDKVSMVSNQLKAYDFAFVAGDAAVARILSVVRRFDRERLFTIGRPQLDDFPDIIQPTGLRIRVLYAPTWEGDSRQMAYSSLPNIGMAIVEELLNDNRFTVVFRPHPKSGTWSRETLEALKKIESRIANAAARNPEAGHRTDKSTNATAAIVSSDVVVADNSAMTMDAVGLDKPVILSTSDSVLRQSERSKSLRMTISALRQVSPDEIGNIADLVYEAATGPIPSAQTVFRDFVFGAPSLGTGTERFIEATKKAISESPPNRE
ncbi:CDP-glycerol glycerophosphotransferase family protein [Paeniglutamicibacter sp. R2-26]|uniref:CDP-glycerol glycerophosphotransferase family protein n=1 Tax=Paeniglutamicibacter sp. R2-26 TaxID=3144417 RepID=UPI003EE6017A